MIARVPSGVKTHLAIDGKSFGIIEKYLPDVLQKLCIRGTIFARMSPEQKCLLIQKQQELGYVNRQKCTNSTVRLFLFEVC